MLGKCCLYLQSDHSETNSPYANTNSIYWSSVAYMIYNTFTRKLVHENTKSLGISIFSPSQILGALSKVSFADISISF